MNNEKSCELGPRPARSPAYGGAELSPDLPKDSIDRLHFYLARKRDLAIEANSALVTYNNALEQIKHFAQEIEETLREIDSQSTVNVFKER